MSMEHSYNDTDRENAKQSEKNLPRATFPSQIPRWWAWNGTRTSAMKGRLLPWSIPACIISSPVAPVCVQPLAQMLKDFTHSYTQSHSHWHSRTHTHTLKHTDTFTLSLTHAHSQTNADTLSLSHTHSHAHSLTLTRSHTHTLSNTHTDARTHTLKHTDTFTHSHSQTNAHTLSLSHTHSLTQHTRATRAIWSLLHLCLSLYLLVHSHTLNTLGRNHSTGSQFCTFRWRPLLFFRTS
jgi:hypothetical protein